MAGFDDPDRGLLAGTTRALAIPLAPADKRFIECPGSFMLLPPGKTTCDPRGRDGRAVRRAEPEVGIAGRLNSLALTLSKLANEAQFIYDQGCRLPDRRSAPRFSTALVTIRFDLSGITCPR